MEGRYEVQLLWKDAHAPLTDNYQLCLKRLHGLVKRSKQDPAILSEYDSTIKKQMQQGIVWRGGNPLRKNPSVSTTFQTMQWCMRQDKETTKVRVVYNVSARLTGPSFNDSLHVGPKLNMNIIDILSRFRAYRICYHSRHRKGIPHDFHSQEGQGCPVILVVCKGVGSRGAMAPPGIL